MVQILPQFDPGKEIGQSVGAGFGKALELLGNRQMAKSAFDSLKNLDTENSSASDIAIAVGEAYSGLPPQMQRSSSEVIELLLKEKQAAAVAKSGSSNKKLLGSNPQAIGASAESLEGGPEGRDIEESSITGTRKGPFVHEDKRESPLTSDSELQNFWPTQEELTAAAAPHIAAGDPKGAERAKQNLINERKSKVDLAIREREVKQKELTQQRELEKELAQEVLSRTFQQLKKNGIVDSKTNSIPDQWERASYNYYLDEKGKPANKSATDQELWNKVSTRLDRRIDDMAQSADKFIRPTWRTDKKSRMQQATKWAQRHLNSFGNTAEDRNILTTQLMDNGWSRTEAKRIVQPMNKGLNKIVSGLPTLKQSLAYAEDAPPSDVNYLSMKEKLLPKLVKSFSQSDSLLGLKDTLVRDKNLSDAQALDLINSMENAGVKFADHQNAEMGYIIEPARPSLYEVFAKDRQATELFDRIAP